MSIRDIPLNQLEHSPLNARTVRNKAKTAQFAASITAHGILENLTVHPTGDDKFGVVIGGTRLDALTLLLGQGMIAPDYPVPCQVRPADDPTLAEISLAENVVRENMHPADEFDAFKRLADAGQGPETIAARFGVSPVIVKQRLKLAVASPNLVAAYRANEMTLDQLMAFTVSDDHVQQEKVWEALPEWDRRRGDGGPIRAALTGQHLPGTNRLVRFVGIPAYEQAGGSVMFDLFDQEGAGWLTDRALLNRLAVEKLEAAAAPVRGEGWKWVEIIPDLNRHDAQYEIVAPVRIGPDADRQAEIDTLQAEADAIMEEHGEEPDDEDAHGRLEEIYQLIEALGAGEAIWTDEQKAVAGAVISVGHDAEITITRGAVKPADRAALRRLRNPSGDLPEPEDGGYADRPAAKEKGGLPAALITELTSHKTVAAQLVLAANPQVALLALTHSLTLQQLYPYITGDHTCLGITARVPSYSLAIRETLDASPAGKKLAALVKGWQKKLPPKPEELWAWLSKQKPATIQNLLAAATALSVDMVQVNGAKAKPAANDLADSIKLDMADHWEATPENYLTRVSKRQLIEDLGDALPPHIRMQVEGMKRDMAAKTIVTIIKGKRWLPPILKRG